MRGIVFLACLAAMAAAGHARGDAAAYDQEVDALAARVASRPANAALAARLEKRLQRVRADPDGAARSVRERLDALGMVPLRVPGLFYQTHRWTGADLGVVERAFGRPVALVPTGETESVPHNAGIVEEALGRASRDGHRVLLVSVSKGSADAGDALARSPDLARHVAAWIDLVGLLDGTPLTDPGVAPEALAALGLPEETARSMSRAARRGAAPRALPPGLRVVHVAAFPRYAAISPEARTGFERLRALGPNDGFLLLRTFLHVSGRVVVVRKVDHYLRLPDLDAQLLALVSLLLDETAASGAAGHPDSH